MPFFHSSKFFEAFFRFYYFFLLFCHSRYLHGSSIARAAPWHRRYPAPWHRHTGLSALFHQPVFLKRPVLALRQTVVGAFKHTGGIGILLQLPSVRRQRRVQGWGKVERMHLFGDGANRVTAAEAVVVPVRIVRAEVQVVGAVRVRRMLRGRPVVAAAAGVGEVAIP